MEFDIAQAPKRDSKVWTQGVITWAEVVAWMDSPAKVKAAGNYVMGKLKGTRRSKTTILSRGMLTLDVDSPDPGFAEGLEMVLPYAAAVHTTYSATVELPRYRVLIPLDRNVFPDEYHTAAAAVMQDLGLHQFDPGSVQPERYMFKPSMTTKKAYNSFVIDGPLASADALLANFQADLSDAPPPRLSKNKRDPFSLQGTIGAFNRAYADFATLIREYELPYDPAGADRWQLSGSAAAAGMGTVAPGLVYSHHTNDPAYGQTCSAFDLARLHLHGELDEKVGADTPINRLPSQREMLETASKDLNVVRELVGSDFDEELKAKGDAIMHDNWRMAFSIDARTGKPNDSIDNWDLLLDHDAAFQGLLFNELSMAIETDRDLPWRALLPGRETFDSGDRASLALHIERTYNIRPPRAYLDDLIIDKAKGRRVNPVVDYLNTLQWDGVARVETCLPGVVPTPFSRLAARKAMTAAVARMMEPGIKWDHMLVLYGPEGLGKSHWVDTMARGYSASLGRLGDKDTLIAMQRSWIMTSDEGHAMRKADFDAQKEFITRTADIFRMPYEREAQVQKRHCVIWGSTNEEAFLRRQEGNRRFHIVRCEDKVDFDLLTDYYVDQVWAEALHLFRNGEQLWLTEEESELASREREQFTEEDATVGLIQAYLDTAIPDDWERMSPESRQMWLMNAEDGFAAEGTGRIDRVCSLQIWVEAMGRRRGDHKRQDLIDITNALKQIPGWRKARGRKRVSGYGPQLVFERIPDDVDLI